ncbi:MAG: molybdenum cofactor guanylyltransferase [Sideroxyarcus sp.]|nr:molybdenum cofactor guanylyltransferase [Sideroxyarcus sp.]
MIEDSIAVVMAGGDSRRMGQDKANLQLGERTLLQSVAATLQPLFSEVFVSVRQPRSGIALPQICDDPAHTGPLAGLAAALEHAATPWVFVVACDMPFITAAVIEHLAGLRVKSPTSTSTRPCPSAPGSEGEEGSSPDKGRLGGVVFQAVVPVVGGHPQPLAAFYAKSCLHEVQACLHGNGKRSFRALLDKLQVCYVSEEQLQAIDPQLRSFFDLDTPQDFQAAQK